MNIKHIASPCFHCGLPVPENTSIRVEIDGEAREMCCYGCQAVASTIVASGMGDFYQYRTEKPARADEIAPQFLQQLKLYDYPALQQHFVSEPENVPGDIKEVSLILEGIVCAACIWLNENHLNALSGVIEANINYSNHRARIRWDNNKIKLSEILESIRRIGYLAHPYDPNQQQKIIERERKQHIKRLGLAGVLGMQIMILAVAMYSGEWWGMDEIFKQSFRWISLAITIPILLFSSQVFFRAALRNIRNLRVGMDVPVSLGIGIAFIASVVNTVQGSGAVYFDSVAMFTFFLLSARYFEMSARKRSCEASEAVLNLQPAIATRLTKENKHETVAVADLAIDDRVLVKPGENIPVDGLIIEGTSGVNESLITGESMPVTKSVNDTVIGGSINTESPLIIKVKSIGDDTVLASIQKLIHKAQLTKPAIARLADKVAAIFVGVILCIATLVALYWYQTDAEQWVAITIATLVVTCPCALSLATPTALTAANSQLTKLGLLPTNAEALETFARTTDFVFDKTGTLTEGRLQLVKTLVTGDQSEQEYLQIAAALESSSEHPVAKCLVESAGETSIQANHLINVAGSGVNGIIGNTQWVIGNVSYIEELFHTKISTTMLAEHQLNNLSLVALASENKIHAVFAFNDVIRTEAKALIEQLKSAGKNIFLMTGDHENSAERIAHELGIDNVAANLKPENKLSRVRALQQRGAIVAMTGDGINDAPVLAGANVSIAMASGTQLAATHADMILLSNNIGHLYSGFQIARKTLRIIRQNLFWAIAYNIIAVPAAAMGYIDPWLAALGMSASSLIVVINALRISNKKWT